MRKSGEIDLNMLEIEEKRKRERSMKKNTKNKRQGKEEIMKLVVENEEKRRTAFIIMQ